MGLSTHVLDTMHGTPAAGMSVALYTTQGEAATLVKSFVLNPDGRNPDGPLYDNASLQKGTYRLVFDVAGYFKARGVALPEPSFLGRVALDFGQRGRQVGQAGVLFRRRGARPGCHGAGGGEPGLCPDHGVGDRVGQYSAAKWRYGRCLHGE